MCRCRFLCYPLHLDSPIREERTLGIPAPKGAGQFPPAETKPEQPRMTAWCGDGASCSDQVWPQIASCSQRVADDLVADDCYLGHGATSEHMGQRLTLFTLFLFGVFKTIWAFLCCVLQWAVTCSRSHRVSWWPELQLVSSGCLGPPWLCASAWQREPGGSGNCFPLCPCAS